MTEQGSYSLVKHSSKIFSPNMRHDQSCLACDRVQSTFPSFILFNLFYLRKATFKIKNIPISALMKISIVTRCAYQVYHYVLWCHLPMCLYLSHCVSSTSELLQSENSPHYLHCIVLNFKLTIMHNLQKIAFSVILTIQLPQMCLNALSFKCLDFS